MGQSAEHGLCDTVGVMALGFAQALGLSLRELPVDRGHDCPSSAAEPHGLHRRLRASR